MVSHRHFAVHFSELRLVDFRDAGFGSRERGSEHFFLCFLLLFLSPPFADSRRARTHTQLSMQLEIANVILTIFFAIEVFVKVVALGFVRHKV